MHEKAGLGAPHTTHCLANGHVMISCMGDPKENAKGEDFFYKISLPYLKVAHEICFILS